MIIHMGRHGAPLRISDAYRSSVESLESLFGTPGEGFFVPIYQREYTWEEENVTQLFEDVVEGIRQLASDSDDSVITFLGTIILTPMSEQSAFQVADEGPARPTGIQIVVDGQQRLSTIALLAIQLRERIRNLSKQLPAEGPYKVLRNHSQDLIQKLENLYSLEARTGARPRRKPKIVRAEYDQWTLEGDDGSHYKSPVALYVATYIRTQNLAKAKDVLDAVSGARVRDNVEVINEYLDAICNAHAKQARQIVDLPPLDVLASKRMQRLVLGFDDIDELQELLSSAPRGIHGYPDCTAASLYNLFVLAYYLLERCSVNRLQPLNEEWGFDMFQALNATGTPLTAMETFRPQVIQAEKNAGHSWEDAPSAESMAEIDALFAVTTSNQEKQKRTSELLRTAALCLDGQKVGNQFSAQRRWLNRHFQRTANIAVKRKFLRHLADIATFFRTVWYMDETDKSYVIKGLDDHPDSQLATFLVAYLRDAKSELSAPVLAHFYKETIAQQRQPDDFVDAVKACAAFFTLWRSAHSTAGLDNVYREFFRHHRQEGAPLKQLKEHFRAALRDEGLGSRESWMERSRAYLLYTEQKQLCRFILFLAGNDRVPDPKNPGLTTRGTFGSCSILTLEHWKSKQLASLEHVAPQKPPANHLWDRTIYEKNLVHHIGNLLLLPTTLNKLADNKDWPTKYLYYCHVGVRNEQQLQELAAEAKKRGINLNRKTLGTLKRMSYSCVVEPITSIGLDGSWNADIIERRTKHIKEIAWDILSEWLDM